MSKAEWSNANGISKSTFAEWIRSTKADVTKAKAKARFGEVKIPTGLQKQPELQEKNTANITVEYKSFKITIPANVDVRTLENTFKVVLQVNV